MSRQKFLSPAKVHLMLPVTAWKKGWPIPAQNRYAPCSKIIYVVSYHSVIFFLMIPCSWQKLIIPTCEIYGQDMVLLHHEMEVEFPDSQATENHKGTLLEFGRTGNGKTTTAMALTVGIPVAIGALVFVCFNSPVLLFLFSSVFRECSNQDVDFNFHSSC